MGNSPYMSASSQDYEAETNIQLKKKYIILPMDALKGIVRSHAQKIFAVTPHFTAVTPFLAPMPTIAPVIV